MVGCPHSENPVYQALGFASRRWTRLLWIVIWKYALDEQQVNYFRVPRHLGPTLEAEAVPE